MAKKTQAPPDAEEVRLFNEAVTSAKGDYNLAWKAVKKAFPRETVGGVCRRITSYKNFKEAVEASQPK